MCELLNKENAQSEIAAECINPGQQDTWQTRLVNDIFNPNATHERYKDDNIHLNHNDQICMNNAATVQTDILTKLKCPFEVLQEIYYD